MIAARPATLVDVARLWPRLPRRAWRMFAVQVTSWPAWTVTVDGKPVLICGAAPARPWAMTMECWLAVPGRFRDVPNRTAVIRFLLCRVAIFLPDFCLVVRVNDANANGRRMAISAGFQATGELIDGTRIRTWVRPPVRNLMSGNRTFCEDA